MKLQQFYYPMVLNLVLILSYSTNISGQASLAAENNITDIVVKTKFGEEKIYSVFQDVRNKDQWYYMPNELRIAEEKKGDGSIGPKMSILRYQYTDTNSDDYATKEGGVLVATFTYAIEPECVEQVKKEIANRRGMKNVNLSAIPLRSATIDFLTESNEFIGDATTNPASFSGATSASQEIVMSFDLTKLGTSVIRTLASSGGGLPVRATIEYNGLTAPCGFKITGNWDNVYTYYEKKQKLEAGLSIGLVSFGGDKSKQEIKEHLQNIQGVKVEEIGCEATDNPKETNINLAELLEKIESKVFSKEILTKAQELDKLESLLRQTSDKKVQERIIDMMNSGKASIQIGAQQSIKDINKRDKGAINYSYTGQRHVKRSTSFGGLLGFSKYGLSEEELEKQGYIIDVDAGQEFPSIIIGLPIIDVDYDLRSLIIEVSYVNKKGNEISEARQWTENNGWVTPRGKSVGFIQFNMIEERNSNPKFKIRVQVVSNVPNADFEIEKSLTYNSGQKFIDAFEIMTEEIILDAGDLDFYRMTGNNQDLANVTVKIQKGDVSINKSIRPFSRNGTLDYPEQIHILLPENEVPLNSEIVFRANTGEQVVRREPITLGENYFGNHEWKPVF